MAEKKNSKKLDIFFKSILDIEGFLKTDNSLNGIQVDNDGSEISKIAFAVDANLETFKRAAAINANMLFVHHGLFWGKPLRLTKNHRERVKFLLDNNICLYAVHLPLDKHPDLGNNGVLAKLLGLTNIESFSSPNLGVGYKGTFPVPVTIEEAVKKIAFMDREPIGIFPFGKKENSTCAVISGGAPYEALQAIEDEIDLFVTGEASHSVYSECLEGKLNMIANGHHSTEVWGVLELMKYTKNKIAIEAEFIDVPTGL